MRKRQKTDIVLPTDLPPLQFEDRFLIRSVDMSKFENVARLKGKSSGFDAEVTLDINCQIYSVQVNEVITIGLASKISSASALSEQELIQHLTAAPNLPDQTTSLIDLYDYVMYGKIFRMEEKPPDRRTIYASFGGLLMSLTADKQVVGELELDLRVYLLVRKKKDFAD